MTEIPDVYNETLSMIDAKSFGPYTFGMCTLAELLDAPVAVNRYNDDDYQNPDTEWILAMEDARELFAEKLRLMRQQREWEEEEAWDMHGEDREDYYG